MCGARSLMIAAALILASTPAAATVILVPSEYSTVQGGIDVALAGDTVLVAAGIYTENILIQTVPIVLLGDTIEQSVILRPDLTAPMRKLGLSLAPTLSGIDTIPTELLNGSVFGAGYTPLALLDVVGGTVKVAGFTIEHSMDAPGVACYNTSAWFTQSVIQDNDGGGMQFANGKHSLVENNIIRRNTGEAGAGVAVWGGATVDLYGNLFLNNRGWLGGAFFSIDDAGHTVSGNIFKGNYAWGGGGGIYYYHGGVAEVTGNLFVSDTSDHGGGVDNSDRQHLRVIGNTFDRCVAGIGGGGGNAAWWAHGAPVGGIFKNNIVTNTNSVSGEGGALGCDQEIVGYVAIDYNDFYDNEPVDHFRFAAGTNDIFLDPLYCNPDGDDYHLTPASPSAGSGQGGVNRGAFATGCAAQSIAIDIMPGTCPNILSLGSYNVDYRGVRPAAIKPQTVAIAIAGSKTFDVAEIDPATIEVLGLAPLRHEIKDATRPVVTRETECECPIGGPDGIDDLILHFEQNALVAALAPYTDGIPRTIDMMGAFKSGALIVGHDCLTVTSEPIPASPLSSDDAPRLNAHPNPFNAATVFEFTLTTSQYVRLDVYDVLGRRVATLANGPLSEGDHQVSWDASGRASGIYFARLTHSGQAVVRKMVLLR